MTTLQLVQRLRARGYELSVDGSDLVVRGPTPHDEPRTITLLREHRRALISLLQAEQHPAVRAATDIMGARMIRFVPAKRAASETDVMLTPSEFAERREARAQARCAELAEGMTAEEVWRELRDAGYLIVPDDDPHGYGIRVHGWANDPNLEPFDPNVHIDPCNPASCKDRRKRRRLYTGGPYANPERAAALLYTHRAELRRLVSA